MSPDPLHRSSGPPAGRDPYAVFRPRRGRAVALVVAGAAVVTFTTVALTVPGGESEAGWRPADRVLAIALGLAIAAFLWRYASIRAVPTEQGLTVRNLFLTRTLEWAEILRVGFSGGAPWVTVELADTEQLAVMAIQKADGPAAGGEASRLAALVEHHSRAQER